MIAEGKAGKVPARVAERAKERSEGGFDPGRYAHHRGVCAVIAWMGVWLIQARHFCGNCVSLRQ